MASVLRYDTQLMWETAYKYERIARDMLKVKAELNSSIADLVASKWVSDAGKAFDKTYSSDWGGNVDKYVAVLRELAKMLRRSAFEYNAVTECADKIGWS